MKTKVPKGRRHWYAILTLLLALQLAPRPAAAQTLDGQATDTTVLKQIIFFGRHSVRSATSPSSTLATFAVQPYPDFGVPTGYLTPHGAQAEVLLGTYFRNYLLAEGLLTGNDSADAQRVYFRANSIQRSNVTAASLALGLLPGASVPVHSYPLGQIDPIFDPIAGNVAAVDASRAVQEVSGIFNVAALPNVMSGDFSAARSVLFNYPKGTVPAPAAPAGMSDPLAMPVPLTATGMNMTGYVIDTTGLTTACGAVDPFVMEYADGMPMANVGWGKISASDISQQMSLVNLVFSIEMTTPYLDQVQSSNAGAHILRTMEQAVKGRKVPGALGSPEDNVVAVISSDAYVVGLAGLLHMHWLLPGYQQDFAAPGGTLVFELRQVRSTGEYVVRAYYTAQTLDQLRNLTPLTVAQPPASMQLLIPNSDHADSSLDISFHKFRELMTNAINPFYVQDPSVEVAPGPLTGVPLK